MTETKSLSTQSSSGRPPRERTRRFWTFRRVALMLLLLLAGLATGAVLVPVPRYVEAQGYVVTDDEAEARASVQGAIQKWLVGSGDDVSKGDVLIQLKDTVQQAALEQAQKEQKALEATLDHLQTAQKLQEAEREQQIFRAERSLKLATDELEKMSASRSGVFSQREIAQAKLKAEMASSQLDELKLPRAEVMARQVEVLRQEIAAADKKVALHDAEVELRKVRAPLNGTIYFQSFEPGEVVKPEHVLGQVFDRRRWVVKLKVPEKYIAHVTLGQPVEIELAGYPALRYGSMPASVARILPVITRQSTGDGTFYIEASVTETPDRRLTPGMSARGIITSGETTMLGRIMGW